VGGILHKSGKRSLTIVLAKRRRKKIATEHLERDISFKGSERRTKERERKKEKKKGNRQMLGKQTGGVTAVTTEKVEVLKSWGSCARLPIFLAEGGGNREVP